MKLIINNVSFYYKSKKVLNDIEFNLGNNELISILGPNGAGKTTLLRCINRILKPQSGSILLEEKNILNFSQNKIAQNISYVAQNGTKTLYTMEIK